MTRHRKQKDQVRRKKTLVAQKGLPLTSLVLRKSLKRRRRTRLERWP
jgi:hypothetical protein